MRRTFSLLVCLIALSSAAALAQQAPAAQRGTPAAQAGTPAPAARSVDSGLDPSDANITIEISVVDKAAGSSATTTRLGTITVANQSTGSVRGLSNYYQGNNSNKLDPLGLDIDARTTLRRSGTVSVGLTVAYIPAGATEAIMSSAQRQQATLFLKPGQETQVLTIGSMTGPGPAVRITAKATVVK